MTTKRILVTPLDWGLGHATRCIPIIRLLLDKGHRVCVGGNGASYQLLKAEFPSLTFVELPGYLPAYPTGNAMIRKMISQLPKFAMAIRREHRALKDLVDELKIDVVISDNRYGCWSSNTKSVFITHQSNILMPKRFGLLGPIVRSINHFLINKFDVVWIPDHPGDESVAGKLISFGKCDLKMEVRYIGHLSRFKRRADIVKKYDVVAVCSGPEPQRSILEDILMKQLQESKTTFVLVRGLVKEGEGRIYANGSKVINYLTSLQLETLLQEGDVVISRSGYSTVMDLMTLEKRAIFIPTPGQTEQEYLASRLQHMRVAYSMKQSEFDLQKALKASQDYKGFTNLQRPDLLTAAIALLETIK